MKMFKRLWCLCVGHKHDQIAELDGHSIISVYLTSGKILKVDPCKRCNNLFIRE